MRHTAARRLAIDKRGENPDNHVFDAISRPMPAGPHPVRHMAIKEIKKIYLLGYREIEGELIRALQELGVVEVGRLLPEASEPAAGEPPADREAERKLEQVEYCLGLLGRFAPPRQKTLPRKVLLSRREYRDVVARDGLEETHQTCRELDHRLGELRARQTRLETERRELLPWQSLDAPLDPLGSPGSVLCRLGQVPLNRYAALREALAARTDLLLLHEVNTDSAAVYLLILCHREEAAAVEEIARDHEFAPLQRPGERRAPREVLAELHGALHELAGEEHRVGQALQDLHPRRAPLMALRDHFANVLTRQRARQFVTRTASSFCLTGWIPEREVPRLRETLGASFTSLEVLTAAPEETDQVPILLENGPVVRPFELVTDLYGRPQYRGVDPTPYMAIFFAAFFGFCLTDAGYGVVLMLITAWLLRRATPSTSEMKKQFYRLFFMGGIATVILGAMVGTWFGITVQWKLFDALEDLMLFFGLALVFGVVHLLTGLGIKMARNIKAGDWMAGVCDQGLWMLIMVALLSFGLVKARLLPAGWYPFTQVASVGAALGIVFFQGRQADKTGERFSGWTGGLYQVLWVLLTLDLSLYLLGMARPASGVMTLTALAAILVVGGRGLKGILARVGLGLYSLYGISGFLGDTLSYSRLVALGLTTGIVGMVINKMAGIALGPVTLGWTTGLRALLALAILVGGHTFNIVINMLGAFVHSCRLQYVEFFTKFYEAGGRPFKPFRFEHTYTVLND